MATDFDRDDRLHGLLRDTLRSQPASGTCIDAGTLAAWAEGALTPEETAAIDTHLATCARCRELAAMLSTMSEADDAPAASVVPFTPRPNGRWKAIVGVMGAVAASALIWVAVRDGSPSPDMTSAANRAEQNPPRGMVDASRDAVRPQGQGGQAAPGAPSPTAKPAQENTARAAEPGPGNTKASAAPVEPSTARPAAPPPATASAAARSTAVTLPLPSPPPAPAPVAPPPPTAGAVADARASTVSGASQSATNIAIDAARQSDVMRLSETSVALLPIVAEFVAGADLQGQQGQGFGAVADRSRAGGGGRGGGGGGAAAVRQDAGGAALAPPPVQWRIHVSALSRSTDAGKTWQPMRLEAITPQLAGGSAPTNTICWLAGRAGTVLLTIDGTTFRQVTKPTDADLVSVRATDARSATVRTADGRTFTTTDGGLTWTPRSEQSFTMKNAGHEGP